MKGAAIEYPEWEKAYREALLELNAEKLRARIFDAETAILKRVKALQTSSDGHRERVAIADALNALHFADEKTRLSHLGRIVKLDERAACLARPYMLDNLSAERHPHVVVADGRLVVKTALQPTFLVPTGTQTVRNCQ